MTRILIAIAEEDGTLLERFVVLDNDPKVGVVELALRVQLTIEMKFETEEER